MLCIKNLVQLIVHTHISVYIHTYALLIKLSNSFGIFLQINELHCINQQKIAAEVFFSGQLS